MNCRAFVTLAVRQFAACVRLVSAHTYVAIREKDHIEAQFNRQSVTLVATSSFQTHAGNT
jgi:hypothetical protein